MALSVSSLKSKITTKLENAGFSLENAPQTIALAQAIAESVCEEITEHSVLVGTDSLGDPIQGSVQ